MTPAAVLNNAFVSVAIIRVGKERVNLMNTALRIIQ